MAANSSLRNCRVFGNSPRNRQSWPLLSAQDRLPLALWFEAEDASWIPEDFHVQSKDELRNPDFVPLRKRLQSSSEYGRKGPRNADLCNVYFTTDGRRKSFHNLPWLGPPAHIMAECGLIRVNQDCARCYCCEVTFRGLRGNTCPWTRHRHFAPFCCHLKRAQAHGHKGGNVASLVRRQFSTNDAITMG